jgi:hypothetical protein
MIFILLPSLYLHRIPDPRVAGIFKASEQNSCLTKFPEVRITSYACTLGPALTILVQHTSFDQRIVP